MKISVFGIFLELYRLGIAIDLRYKYCYESVKFIMVIEYESQESAYGDGRIENAQSTAYLAG